MKVENLSSLMVQWFHHKPKVLLKGREVLMMKSYHIICPKCNNNHLFYRYGKDSDGYQKYLCRNCHHQFAPERPRPEGQIVGGSIRLDPYAERRAFCTTIMSIILTTVAAIRNAAIPFFEWKATAITAPSISSLFGKHNFERMRYPIQIIITAL